MKQFNYTVCSGDSAIELAAGVNKLLALGWVCQGGIAIVRYSDTHLLYQALVQEKIES